MNLSRDADSKAYGWTGPLGMNLIEMILRHQDEISRERVDRLRMAFDLPVYFTLQHGPPFVVDMVMPIVDLPWKLTDAPALKLICFD